MPVLVTDKPLSQPTHGASDGELRQVLEDLLNRKFAELDVRLRTDVRNELHAYFRLGGFGGPGRYFAGDDDDNAEVAELVERCGDSGSVRSAAETDITLCAAESPSLPMDFPQRSTARRTSLSSTCIAFDHEAWLVESMPPDTGQWTTATCFEKRTGVTIRSKMHEYAARFVSDQRFDWCICGLIVANALFLGCQTDLMARTASDQVPGAFGILQSIFCVIFTLELIVKLYVFRSRYCTMSCWQWNMFDMCVVLLQLVEEVSSVIGTSLFNQNLSFARMLKLMRLIRIIRLARILRMIHELRVLVSCITNSIKSLVWTCLLLFILIYSNSLILTQLVHDFRMGYDSTAVCSADDDSCENHEKAVHYYGTLARSMLTLFQAISGGVDWDHCLFPLMEEISPLLGALFCLYVMFAVLAMMNVVTGIFVDSVLLNSKQDKDNFLLNNAREIIKDAGNSHMTEEHFIQMLGNKHMIEFFKGIDVDPCSAPELFKLMDIDETGEINAEEFLSSCIKLRGPAKAFDMALLQRELRRCATRPQEAEGVPQYRSGISVQLHPSEQKDRS